MLELEDALVASRSPRARRARAARATSRRSATATRAGFLARYFEKLRYTFGPRERAGLYTFLELAHEVGELDRVPELRFVAAEARPSSASRPSVLACGSAVDRVLGLADGLVGLPSRCSSSSSVRSPRPP